MSRKFRAFLAVLGQVSATQPGFLCCFGVARFGASGMFAKAKQGLRNLARQSASLTASVLASIPKILSMVPEI